MKVVCALDELRPSRSLTRNARFEPIFVALPLPVGRVVAREGAYVLSPRVLPLPRQEETMSDENKVASIDVHKKVLMVVVGAREGEAIPSPSELQRRRFGTTTSELRRLSAWLRSKESKK